MCVCECACTLYNTPVHVHVGVHAWWLLALAWCMECAVVYVFYMCYVAKLMHVLIFMYLFFVNKDPRFRKIEEWKSVKISDDGTPCIVSGMQYFIFFYFACYKNP